MNDMVEIKIENIRPGYFINKKGEVYSSITNKFLAESPDKDGYLRVGLRTKDKKNKTYKRHRLVLMVFNPVENYEELTVNHKDGDKTNNNLENLEWATNKENISHAIKNKLIDKNNKILNYHECEEICKILEKGYTASMVAKKLYPKESKRYAIIIQDIKSKTLWTDVSCKYNIEVGYKYPNFSSVHYSVWQIEEICEKIKEGKKNKGIALEIFGESTKRYSDLISGIRTGKKYRMVSKYYF